MKLRNKKTGQIVDLQSFTMHYSYDFDYGVDARGKQPCSTYNKTLKEICEEWEDYPEEPKTVWDLEDGDLYYSIDIRGTIELNTWSSHGVDYNIRNAGNVFLTKEEAEKELARRKAKVVIERDTKGFKPDWSKLEQLKWFIYYRSYEDNFTEKIGLHIYCNREINVSTIYFTTKEDAEKSIKTHEKEWKIYLGVEE